MARWFALAGMVIGLGSAAHAEPVPPPSAAVLAERMTHRFPQPVQVGLLIGRLVLAPEESQPVLGRVEAVARGGDGALLLVMRRGGLLGIGARAIAVPLDGVALLGEHVAVMDFSPEQLDSTPDADPTLAALPREQTVHMGIVRPFH